MSHIKMNKTEKYRKWYTETITENGPIIIQTIGSKYMGLEESVMRRWVREERVKCLVDPEGKKYIKFQDLIKIQKMYEETGKPPPKGYATH